MTAATALTRTKLHRPRLPEKLIARPQLLARLRHQQTRPLLYVSAPAGYSKTTLVASWLESHEWPAAWLSLDAADDDLTLFLAYFVAALQEILPEFGSELRAMLHGGVLPPPSVVAGLLLNALDDLPQDVALVLDDYHFIQTPAVHDLLTHLLRHPPRRFHLAILTRHDPPLPLARLRARQQMIEIRAPDLQFSLEETAAFLQARLRTPLDSEEIAALHAKTEGWITGLHLAALFLRQNPDVENLLAALATGNRFITDYLVGEVLSHLPPHYRERLLQTAILDRFCAPLCQALWSSTAAGPTSSAESAEAQAFITWLTLHNPFIVPLDAAGLWFRHHHLIRELLLAQLHAHTEAGMIARLHRRASQWFAAQGYVEDALRHALAAGDEDGAIQLIRQHRHEALNQEEWPRVERWLHLLPDALIERSADLLLLRAWILQNRWRLSDLPPLLARIAARLQAAPDAHLAGEWLALSCPRLYWWEANGPALEATARQALDQLPLQAVYARDYAWLFFARGLHMTGDLAGALAAAQSSLDELAALSGQPPVRRLAIFCFINWCAADLPALQRAASSLTHLGQVYNRPFSVALGHYFSGAVCLQQQELDAAERHFTEVLERRYQSNAQYVIHSLFGLAAIRETRGQLDEAYERVEEAEQFILELKNVAQWPLAQAFRAHLALAQGRVAEAAQLLAAVNVDGLFQATPNLYSPAITYGRLLIAQRHWSQAADFLNRLQAFLEPTHSFPLLIETLVLQTLLAQAQGQPEAALPPLEQAITLAAPGRLIRPFASNGAALAPLLDPLAARGIAPAFIALLQATLDKADPAGGVNPGQQAPETAPPPAVDDLLTNREIDVLLLLEKRLTNKEIAARLGISVETVKGHAARLYHKLEARNRRQAVTRAYRLGVLGSK